MDDQELENRLASYRPVVERAIADRPLQRPSPDGRRSRWVASVAAAATVAAGVAGWVAIRQNEDSASTRSDGPIESMVAPETTISRDEAPSATLLEQYDCLISGVDGPPASTIGGWTRCDTNGAVYSTTTGPNSVVALGDIVMLGAASVLDDYPAVLVDAAESRQFSDLVARVDAFDGPPDAVVIHVGTSGTIDPNDLTAVMDQLHKVPQVVVLTLALDRPWVDGNNQLIRELPAHYPNVIVLDWAVLAPECVGNCFANDGFHLSADGADYYASLIANLLGVDLSGHPAIEPSTTTATTIAAPASTG